MFVNYKIKLADARYFSGERQIKLEKPDDRIDVHQSSNVHPPAVFHVSHTTPLLNALREKKERKCMYTQQFLRETFFFHHLPIR